MNLHKSFEILNSKRIVHTQKFMNATNISFVHQKRNLIEQNVHCLWSRMPNLLNPKTYTMTFECCAIYTIKIGREILTHSTAAIPNHQHTNTPRQIADILQTSCISYDNLDRVTHAYILTDFFSSRAFVWNHVVDIFTIIGANIGFRSVGLYTCMCTFCAFLLRLILTSHMFHFVFFQHVCVYIIPLCFCLTLTSRAQYR